MIIFYLFPKFGILLDQYLAMNIHKIKNLTYHHLLCSKS
jgi:hypothetical protein